jgi:ATP-dependent Clp protease ATP-binding subunit ClpC
VLLAHGEASRTRAQLIGTEHLLLGLLRTGEGMAFETLERLGVDIDRLRLDLERQMEYGVAEDTNSELSFNPDAQYVLQLAYAEARQMNDQHIGTEHILLGLLRLGKGSAYRLLRHHAVDLPTVRAAVAELAASRSEPREQQSKSKTPHLDHFSRDLTELARDGTLDPIIGREKEMERVVQILCRRTKNNPCLIGEAGVGKTAIAEGLAQRIANNEVPDLLSDRRVVALDLASVVAGTKYRGEFEERMKRVMEEIRASEGRIIVFLDELHTIVGTGAAEGAMDASNILKPALARGEMQCIGATTLDEFRKHVERIPSLERRFQPVMVDEPSPDEALKILEGIRERYEQFHGVVYEPEAVDAAVDLSARYIPDRSLPDKAIDLLDEAGSRVKLRRYHIGKRVNTVTARQDVVGVGARSSLGGPVAGTDELSDMFGGAAADWRLGDEVEAIVTREDIAQIVSTWTGVPVTTLTEEETGKLLRMEELLHEDIVGQDEAIRTISKAVRRARAGIKDPRRPTGSFIFLGPTGVGKTLLARVLARFLFGDEDALIRIDMSEYMEKFAVSRLIGAPPGYVGYEESGQLSEAVRRRPYSVVLFDEIEKAHPEVFSILLQVMEDGRLTDAQGRTVDFKNAVIIMTSNVGARMISETKSLGFAVTPCDKDECEFNQEYDRMKGKVTEELKKTFSPEFLNRVDDVVVFHALTPAEILSIVNLELRTVREQMAKRGITLIVTDALTHHLAKHGYDPAMGARPLRRAIRRLIEDRLSEYVLSSDADGVTEVTADVDELGEVVFQGVAEVVEVVQA